MSVAELVSRLASGATTAERLYALRRKAIRQHDAELNAFITVFRKESKRRRPGRGYLRGITVALKDNIYVKGHRTTAGSRILRNFVPAGDADVVTRLNAAGVVVLGKTNMHEFAFGVTNVNPHFGDCRNPWNRSRVSGGSSGGSAVAVAQGMACAAVGTDTAGSVRIPASLCGVVGYKPTSGLVSAKGTVPLSWTLDSVGFLTRSVADAALLGSLTIQGGASFRKIRPISLRGLRLGVPDNILTEVEEDVRRRYDEALQAGEDGGARLVHFKFPDYHEAIACRSLITHAEAASYHRRYFLERYNEYGADLRQRLAQGLAIPAAVYVDALRARRTLIDNYRSVFRIVDLIALPTTRIAAPSIEASKTEESAGKIRRALLAFTEPLNVYGAPAISLPSGLTRERLPVGFQLAGDLNSDVRLLSAALALEREMPAISERPPFGN